MKKTLKLQFIDTKGPINPYDGATGEPETGIKVVDNDRQLSLLNLECSLAYLVYWSFKEHGKIDLLEEQKKEVLITLDEIKKRLNEINDGSFIVEDLVSNKSF